MAILIFFVAHWYLSLFSQTFLMHRYAAHGAFQMSKRWERFFYVVAYVTMGSSYLSPRAYAIMHRLHHAYTDTPRDPHSPKYYPTILSMMLNTAKVYRDIGAGRMEVEERFSKNVPDWPAMDKWGSRGRRECFGDLIMRVSMFSLRHPTGIICFYLSIL